MRWSKLAGMSLAGLFASAPAVSAQGLAYMVKPAECPALLGLLGPSVPTPRTSVQVLFLPGHKGALLTILPRRVKAKSPIRDLSAAVELPAPPPAADPHLLLRLHVVDTIERPIDQRQLVLALADSTVLDFGSMHAYRLSKPGARKVEQDLTSRIPAMPFRRIARAEGVTINLGDVNFALSREQMDGLRALYAVAACGGKPA